MEQEIEQLKNRVSELESVIKSFMNYSTIPHEFDQAFRERFELRKLETLTKTSTKSATSENQAVNEGGAGIYSVLKAPDGFDERNDGGTVKYYPYYTD